MPIDKSETTTRTPIRDAYALLDKVRATGHTKIAAALSGGKDSIATLDLCIQYFGQKNVHPFYLYWIKDLECENAILNKIQHFYKDMPQIVKIPHYGLAEFLRNCTGRSLTPSIIERLGPKSMWTAKKTEKVARMKTGAKWIAGGHRISDSLHRRGMLHQCSGFWQYGEKTREPIYRVYPIYKWSSHNVFSYLKERHLPTPDMFGNNYNKASGIELTNPVFISHLQRHYPNDYARVKHLFPFIEDARFRDEVRAKLKIQNQSNIEY